MEQHYTEGERGADSDSWVQWSSGHGSSSWSMIIVIIAVACESKSVHYENSGKPAGKKLSQRVPIIRRQRQELSMWLIRSSTEIRDA
jgi:hypothetical protein